MAEPWLSVEDGLLGVAALALALAVVLLAILIGGARRWPVKLFALAATFVALWSAQLGVEALLGYPVRATVPDRAPILASHVTEPDPRTGTAGAIALWLRSPSGTPRAVRVPYSRALHEALHRAADRRRDGQRLLAVRRGGGIDVELDGARRLPPKPTR